MNNHRQIWNEFCTTHNISTNKVPLFDTSSGLAVKTKQIGKPNPRNILCRSPEMDTLIRAGWRAGFQWFERTEGNTATCQQFGINPSWTYLRDSLTKLPTTPADQLHTLLPPRQLKTLSNLLFGTGPFLADFLYGFPEFPALNRAAFVSFLNLRHKKFSDIFVFLYLDESKPCYLRKNLTLKQAN